MTTVAVPVVVLWAMVLLLVLVGILEVIKLRSTPTPILDTFSLCFTLAITGMWLYFIFREQPL